MLSGKIKTHNLGYQETDTVQAVFDKEHCANRLHLQAKWGVYAPITQLQSSQDLCIDLCIDREDRESHLFYLPSTLHRILSEVVSNFSNSLDEVTLTVDSVGLKLKNYVDDLEGEF